MNDHLKIIICLAAIFILAFGLRADMLQYNELFEPDNYFEIRMNQDVLINGEVNNPDKLAYYQVGGAPQTYTSPLWVINSFIYNILFSWNIGFDQTLFLKFIQIISILGGALTAIVLYFVGKTASNGNKAVGLFVAFVAAVVPAYVYRTMAGAQMSNATGFLPFALGLLFLMWAFDEKKLTLKSIACALISGIMFMYMVFAWSMFLIIPLVLIAYWAYRIVSCVQYQKNLDVAISDIVHFFIIFGIFCIATLIKQFDFIAQLSAFMGIPYFAVLIGIYGTWIIGSIFILFRPRFDPEIIKYINWAIAAGLIIISIGLIYFTTLNIDPVDRSSVGGMVGEESLGSGFFIQKYNIFLAFIPFLLIIPGLLYFWKEDEYQYMPMFFAGFVLFFVMAWMKLKFTYPLGFGMAFAAIIIGLFFYELWKKIKDNKNVTQMLFVPAIFFVLIGIAASGVFIQDYVPQTVGDPALANVISYLNTTPENSKVMNEWGYGHILAYSTHRAVSADNRNYSTLANQQYARFIVDTNTQEVYNMVREMGADYILVDLGAFYGMRNYVFYKNDKIDASLGTEFILPLTNIIDCGKDTNNLICPGMGTLNIEEHSKWSTIPYDFYNGTYPIYVYAINNSAVILNKAQNNTNLAHVLVGTPETKGMYEQVYISGHYIILKVKK